MSQEQSWHLALKRGLYGKIQANMESSGRELIELGPAALTDEELLAILIGTGYKGRTAQDIAKELLDKYYSIAGLLGKTFADFPDIKGLKKGKIARIAAPFEMTKRIFNENEWDLPNSRLVKLNPARPVRRGNPGRANRERS